MTEKEFFNRIVKKQLDSLPNCFWFIKEAKLLRGLPDICGTINGKSFYLELKRSEKEYNRKTGGIALQRLIIQKIQKAGGYASFAYPENWSEVFQELQKLAS